MTQLVQILFLLIEVCVLVLLSMVVLTPLLMTIGWLRNPIVSGIGYVARLVIVALSSLAGTLAEARGTLRQVAERTLAGLDYRSRYADSDHEPSGYRGWDVIGPLVYLAAVVVIALGDFDLMSLRLEALFNLNSVSPLPLSMLGLFLGLLWLATVAVYASIVFDLHGLSPITRPFHNASPRFSRVLPVLVWGGIVLSLISGGVLWYVGSQDATGQATPLAVVFLVLFAILMNGALVLASWAIHPALLALFYLVVSVLRIVAWLAEHVLVLAVRLLDALARVLVALIDIPAQLGRKLHNYLCNFGWFQRVYWHPWPEFAEVPSALTENVTEDNVLLSDRSVNQVGSPRITLSEEAPRPPIGTDTPMALPTARRTTIVLSIGALGAQLMDTLWPALRSSAVQGTLLAVGEYNDETIRRPRAFVLPSLVDISPTADELAVARGEELSDAKIRQRLLSGMVQRTIALLIAAAAAAGQVIVLADAEDIDDAMANAFDELHRRRQEQDIILVTCHQPSSQDPAALARAENLLAQMHEARTITAVLAVEGTHAEDVRNAAVALASLVSARTLTLDNPSFADVLARLKPGSGQLGVACARADVASLPDAPSHVLARARSKADLQDTLIQTRHAAEQALKCLAPTLAGEQVALVITIPLRPGSVPWEQFRRDMESWLHTQRARPFDARDLLVLMPGRALETHVAVVYPAVPRTPMGEGESQEDVSEMAGQFGTSPIVDADPVRIPSAIASNNGTR